MKMKQDDIGANRNQEAINILNNMNLWNQDYPNLENAIKGLNLEQLKITSKQNNTFLHLAIYKGYKEAVEFILTQDVNIRVLNYHLMTPFDLAAALGHITIAKFLFKKDPKCYVNGIIPIDSPLHYAAMNGHLEMVKFLYSQGLYVNAENKDNETPLYHAALHGYLEIVKFLIEKSDSKIPKNDKSLLLRVAAMQGHFEVMKFLFSLGASLTNDKGTKNTPLHLAAGKGHLGIVQFLLENGSYINAENEDQETPLHKTVKIKGCLLSVAQLLIDKGSNVNAKDHVNRTPLHWACLDGRLDIITLLVDNGAKLDELNHLEETPLHNAASHGHFEVVQYLISKGANPNILNNKGQSPLHVATYRGSQNVAKFLWDITSEDLHTKLIEFNQTQLNSRRYAKQYSILNIIYEQNSIEKDNITAFYGEIFDKYCIDTSPLIVSMLENKLHFEEITKIIIGLVQTAKLNTSKGSNIVRFEHFRKTMETFANFVITFSGSVPDDNLITNLLPELQTYIFSYLNIDASEALTYCDEIIKNKANSPYRQRVTESPSQNKEGVVQERIV